MKYSVARQKFKGKKLSHFDGNIRNFCNAESYMASQQKVTHYSVFTASPSTFYIALRVSQQYTEDQLLPSHCNNGYAYVPQRYVTGTLPIMLDSAVV